MRTSLCTALQLLFGLSFVLATPLTSQAAITKVTLFPQSAIIEEKGSITLQASKKQRTGYIMLPGQADPSSLAFVPPKGVSLTQISSESIVSVDSKHIAQLKQQLEHLNIQQGKLRAKQQGLAAQLVFWKSRQDKEQGSLAQLKQLSLILAQEIETAMMHKDKVTHKLDQIAQNMAELNQRLADIQGGKKKSWKITLAFTPGTTTTLPCSWSYSVRQCGWKPLYRLEALPEQQQIRFTWQARVHQSTGLDWNDVQLALATGKMHLNPTLPGIRPWILQSVKTQHVSDKAVMMEMAAPRAVMSAARKGGSNEAREERKGTFSTWQLGQRTLAAGDDTRLTMKEDVWSASFTYILRPSVSTWGFLHATIGHEEALDLPYGEAMLLVDGAFLRKQGFAFSGKKQHLFFGPDPLVHAKAVLKDKKTGTSGVFSHKETWSWDWDLIITNNKSIPIEAVVEEPKPISRDEDIVVSISGTPAPKDTEDNPDTMTWSLSLDPGVKQTLSLHVEAKAPEDMSVDPGWRW